MRKKFVDKESKEVDILWLQATDLPFNPRVTMPWGLSTEEEVKFVQLKMEVDKIAKEMAGNCVYSNRQEWEVGM